MSDSFDGVIGHERVVELLRREVSAPAQAYLFTGPDSVGKATLAVRFAAALLCAERGEHDVECRSCRLVREGVHPDVTVVEPEGATSLGVDQAREVVTRSSLRPVESDRSVFLFPEAGTMTEQAANALLKTLEEPTASVVFLLVAESEDDFPATVASRCRTIHVGRVPQATMVAALEGRGLDHAAAEGVAVVSGGRPGLALALMDRPEVSRFRDLWLAIPGQVTPHPGDGQRLASECAVRDCPVGGPVGLRGNDQGAGTTGQTARRAIIVGERSGDPGLVVHRLGFVADGWAGTEQRSAPRDIHRREPAQGRRLCGEDPRCRGRHSGQSEARAGAGQSLRRPRVRDLISVPRSRYLRHRGCRWGRPTPRGRSGRR